MEAGFAGGLPRICGVRAILVMLSQCIFPRGTSRPGLSERDEKALAPEMNASLLRARRLLITLLGLGCEAGENGEVIGMRADGTIQVTGLDHPPALVSRLQKQIVQPAAAEAGSPGPA